MKRFSILSVFYGRSAGVGAPIEASKGGVCIVYGKRESVVLASTVSVCS